MPSAIGSNQGFVPQQTQIALSSSFSDIQLLSNFDALELQGHVFIDAASDYRASFKLSIIKNGAGVYEIAASDIAGDDYLGSPIMSFQISGNYLQCKMDVASPTSGYVKFNIDTPTPALVGSSSLSIEGSNIVSTVPSNRLDADVYKQDNVLGTVSQASGVPTGAIIESGSNANGNYIKYADGTMVCTFTTPNISITGGTSATYSGTWPAEFIAKPVANITQATGHGDANYACSVGTCNFNNALSTTSYAVRFKAFGTASTNVTGAIIAIGRWY